MFAAVSMSRWWGKMMARSRIVKPEFWSDEKLALVPREARLNFAGLWRCSDDYGVTKGHPAWLKAQIFPYDVDLTVADFRKWLADLEQIGVIDPFMADGESFFFVRNFADHQKVDRPSKMRNPPCPRDILAGPSRVSCDPLATDSRECSDELVAASLNPRHGYRVPHGKGSPSITMPAVSTRCPRIWSRSGNRLIPRLMCSQNCAAWRPGRRRTR
ncbi:MAG: hypothetical protein ACYDAA_06670 [Syntrophales bacterium]